MDSIDSLPHLKKQAKLFRMPVKHVNSDGEFDRSLKAAGGRPVCADFFAEWCGPCKHIAPFFDQLSSKYPTVVFLKIDVDQCSGTSAKYGVSAMPTFIMMINGAKKDSVRGADSSSLESMVRKYAYSGSGGATVGGGSTTGGGGQAADPVFAEPPGIWQAANVRLRTAGVPNLSAGGFVFEPVVLALALIGLLFYGPVGPLLVLGLAVIAQTSFSPFERYAPGDNNGGAAGPGAARAGPSTSQGGNNRPFSGSGRRVAD